MELRDYQTAAVRATWDWLQANDGDPVIIAPTGSGKAVLIAQLARDVATRWGGRMLCLVHVGELVRQNFETVRRHSPDIDVGIYSAGLGSRNTGNAVLIASIQSVYRKATLLGRFDVVMIDEAHRVGDDDASMYRQFLKEVRIVNPECRVIGTTATPFRLQGGWIYGPGRLFDAVSYEIGIRELIARSYLCPVISKAGLSRVDTSQLHIRGGEFIADEVEQLMDDDALVIAACDEIVELTRDRQATLIFTSGIRHGLHVQRVFRDRYSLECAFVSGETPIAERNELFSRFRREPVVGLFQREPLRYLASCQLLCEGFDAPRTDCVVLLRATASPGFYSQMVGRGLRLHPSKRDTLILDYGNNIVRHGPIDAITICEESPSQSGEAPAKECPECRTVVAAAYSICPECGFAFPKPERTRHEATASEAGILSGQVSDEEFEVRDVWYSVHTKKGADETAPKTMRVDYRLGLDHWQSEWICVEHTGYARAKAEAWWHARSNEPMPETAQEAVSIANSGGLATPEFITVRSIAGEKFDRIIGHRLGPKPEGAATAAEDVPF